MLISILAASLSLGQPDRQPQYAVDAVVEVPRAWLLGGERSTVAVRPAHLVALLGQPYGCTMGLWSTADYYACGLCVTWETPGFYFRPASRLGPRVLALLRVWPPGWSRPVGRLLGAWYTPAPSLMEVGWLGYGVRLSWNFEK
jgi:hypothetical protein